MSLSLGRCQQLLEKPLIIKGEHKMNKKQKNVAPDNYDEVMATGICMAVSIITDTPDATAMLRLIKANPSLMQNIETYFVWLIQSLNDKFEKDPTAIVPFSVGNYVVDTPGVPQRV
jgi:hypothetical protein